MKAKEVMKKYNITRNTLSNWVKKGYIKIEKTLSGRYIYLESEKKEIQNDVGK
jgi:predicted site-specific integrase-resolvase